MGPRRRDRDRQPTDPAWHPDPFQRHERRWWDGTAWTGRVRDDSTIGIDPPVIDTKPEAVIPVAPAAPIEGAVQPLPRTNWATIVGLVVAAAVVIGLVALIALSV